MAPGVEHAFALVPPAACARPDRGVEQQRAQGDRQRKPEALLLALDELALDELAFHSRNLVVKDLELKSFRGGGKISSAGAGRDALQRVLIETAEHGFAAGVLFVPHHGAVRSSLGNKLPLGAAQTDGKHADIGLHRGTNPFLEVAGGVLAVGHENDGPVTFLTALEQRYRNFDRVTDRAARFRHGVHVDGPREHHGRVVIDGERAQRHRFARKRHQPHAVALEPADQIADLALGRFEPVGRDVLGQHRERGVQRDHHVDALPLDFDELASKARAGDGADHHREGQQAQDAFGELAAPAKARRQRLFQIGADEAAERAAAAPRRHQQQHRHHRNPGQRPQPYRSCKLDHALPHYGVSRNTVSASPSSRTNNPRAGMINHRKRSVYSTNDSDSTLVFSSWSIWL